MWLDDGQTTWAVLGVEEAEGAVRLITDAFDVCLIDETPSFWHKKITKNALATLEEICQPVDHGWVHWAPDERWSLEQMQTMARRLTPLTDDWTLSDDGWTHTLGEAVSVHLAPERMSVQFDGHTHHAHPNPKEEAWWRPALRQLIVGAIDTANDTAVVAPLKDFLQTLPSEADDADTDG